jgi:hypothetical protein
MILPDSCLSCHYVETDGDLDDGLFAFWCGYDKLDPVDVYYCPLDKGNDWMVGCLQNLIKHRQIKDLYLKTLEKH